MWKRNKDNAKKATDTGKKSMEAGASGESTGANKDASGDDLSMEEILQSIRRIIADDESDDKDSDDTDLKNDTKNDGDAIEKKADISTAQKKNKGASMSDDEDVPGSNMLELTDMLSEDGTVVNVKKETGAQQSTKANDDMSFDILNQIDEALTPQDSPSPASENEVSAHDDDFGMESIAAELEQSTPVDSPAPASVADRHTPEVVDVDDSLLSDTTAQAASASLSKLKGSKPAAAVVSSGIPPLRSGTTVEDMLMEMMRPMLKSWLDANLPRIVEDIVEREVKKLTR